MRKWTIIGAVFFLGLSTSWLANLFFPSQTKIALPKSSQLTQEATSASSLALPRPDEKLIVKRVIDGDTVELDDGQRVRYIGLDTPELVHPQKSVECFGQEAKEKNMQLVEGKTVRLEKDISETDKYGRLLRYVYVGDIFVNDYLVRQGFAHASTFPPDVKYAEQFRLAEQEARENNRGLWEGCQLNTTNITNTTNEKTEEKQVQGAQTGCLIKGNISSSSEKIYHVPGCGSYDKTVIDESKGEQWFCTEEDAVNAGWRKAKNC